MLALTLLAGRIAFGQETPGVSQGPQTGTVMKGRAPVAQELLQIRFPKPASFVLKNGLRVFVLVDRRYPVVRFNLSVEAGALFEDKPGVAAATAAMLTEGAGARNSLQIAEDTEGIGANLSASAGAESANISASGLSASTDSLIDLMADVLLRPTFPADRLDRYLFAERSGLAARRSNPTALSAELFSQVFYGGTKYARKPPTREDLAAITGDSLKMFHDAYYRPNGAILGVTGDVNVAKLKAKLELALGEWKQADQPAVLPSANFTPPPSPQIYLIDRPNSAQSVLQFGVLGVKQTDPDFIALTIANRILGGGSSGRLFQNIRERKGYTYGAYSTLVAGKWPGTWGANASVRTAVTEPAVREFYGEFKRLASEPVTQDELDRAKRSIIGGFARTLETPEGILARTLELVQNDLPLDYWDKYSERVNAVTIADVQRVAQKYLGQENIQLMVVGERSQIESGLAKFGDVKVVDPNKIAQLNLP